MVSEILEEFVPLETEEFFLSLQEKRRVEDIAKVAITVNILVFFMSHFVRSLNQHAFRYSNALTSFLESISNLFCPIILLEIIKR